MVGVAVHGSTRGGKFSDLRVAFFGVGDRPSRAAQFERALEGRSATEKALEFALAKLDAELEPRADLQASAATKFHLAKVLVGRVLKQMEGVVS